MITVILFVVLIGLVIDANIKWEKDNKLRKFKNKTTGELVDSLPTENTWLILLVFAIICLCIGLLLWMGGDSSFNCE